MVVRFRVIFSSFILLALVACGGGGGESTVTPPSLDDGSPSGTQNSAPSADAGPDQSLVVGAQVTLDGGGSSDPDGDTITYEWEFQSTPSASEASLSDTSAQSPTFTADVIGDFVIQLVVSDGSTSSEPDTITVQAVSANQPVADAGVDQSVNTGDIVSLDGSESLDPNEDLITYEWDFTQRPDGSTAALSDSSAVNPSFTADLDGLYLLKLTVSDPDGLQSSDSVEVTAETVNSVPIANAGPDQNVATNSVVPLDGSGSSDADNDGLSYSWEITSLPEGSTALLDDVSSSNPSFIADVDGEYTVNLNVNDGAASSEPDSVLITAATQNSAPVANAGPNQSVNTGATVTLDGSESSDSDDDTLTYDWSFTSIPDGSEASLADDTNVTPTFVTDVDGTYVVGLVVNDGEVDSDRDSVSITSTAGNSSVPKLRFFVKGSGATASYDESSLPYLSTTQDSITTTEANCTVGEFRLRAEGGDFVITELTAGALTGDFTVAFTNLSNDQIISDGSTVDFALISANSSGNKNVGWSFTVQETGATFRVGRALNCNSAQ